MTEQAARSGRWGGCGRWNRGLQAEGRVDFSVCGRGSHWRALRGVWFPVTKLLRLPCGGRSWGGSGREI